MILYYKEVKNEFSVTLKWFLAVFRTIAITLISFLLLNPMLKSTTRHSEKPIIIFAQDNSQSIVSGNDSAYYRNQYNEKIKSMLEGISSTYIIDKFTFGEAIDKEYKPDYSDKLTDIAGLFENLSEQFAGQNIGALILASDGIYNKGINPLYSLDKLNYPVYTIALGDTNVKKDIILFKVNYNRIAYLNNEFPVQILIKADKAMNSVSELTISKKDSVIYRKPVHIGTDNFFETSDVHLKADKPGLQRYTVRLKGVDGEMSMSNNYQDIFIDILEDRQKIVILAQAPHPDVSAIKQALISNQNYVVEDYIIDKFDKKIEGYNLIILHNLPSTVYNLNDITQSVLQHHIPVLYIIGRQSNLVQFNKLNTGMLIRTDQVIFNEANPDINKEFSLFNLSSDTHDAIAGFPPLISPYGNSIIQPHVNILFFQRIGTVITAEPQLAMSQTSDSKIGVIYGNGIWKWRLTDYAKSGNHNAFDEIINKTIQYLSIEEDKSLFKVYCKNNFRENEDVELDAEVYNENYEFLNGQDISISITDSKNNKYSFVFNNSDSAYFLNAGKFQVDRYSYSARVQVKEKIYTDQGEFTVSPLTVEKVNLVANHNLLYNIARNSGGFIVYPDSLNDLTEKIKNSENIKTIVSSRKSFTELLNFPALLMILILLFAAEWFVRKRAGAY
jgi:hypothetical protein